LFSTVVVALESASDHEGGSGAWAAVVTVCFFSSGSALFATRC
jgi:hypothetical protein